ncbi:MAG TPA: TRAP transporter large permease [Candidatus Agathobaculum stercoravium]|nr:TRAP transporter large permease [uncultured Agathobaculum sp.]HIV96351.1 TRAP transporter large permease [Candidatus Agathobaculum stercoravium]
MSVLQIGLLLLGSFFLMLALSVPVSISLIISSIVTVMANLPLDLGTFVACQKMVSGVDSFSLLAVPFFILTGVLMNTGGIAQRLINLANVVVGRIPGGLAHTNIVGNTMFGALSGSAVAASIAVGGVLLPMEEKAGYDKKFAAAANIASAPTGLIIPPSGILIIYAVLSGSSVVGMIMSGYIPGVMWCIACMVVAYIIAKKNKYPTTERLPAKVVFKYFVDAIPSLILIAIILGGISSGVFTATESAAVAVAYTLFLAMVVYKSIKPSDLPAILRDACETTAVIMFLIAASAVMSFVMSFTGLPDAIGNALLSVSDNKYVILLLINLLLLVAGMFMDITPAVLIFAPIFLPVVTSFGMDPIHFGIMMVMNLGVGNMTPPVGSSLFSGCQVSGFDMDEMVKPLLPFYAAVFVALMLVAYVPWFSMVLPNLVLG